MRVLILTFHRYYLRSANYADIVEREIVGTFPVQLVHSAVLINLMHEKTADLTFVRWNLENPDAIPDDDIITFARSAQASEISQFVTNRKVVKVTYFELSTVSHFLS